jgi:hypothetical protein
MICFCLDRRTAPGTHYIVCLFSPSQFIVYDILHSFFSIREAVPDPLQPLVPKWYDLTSPYPEALANGWRWALASFWPELPSRE